MGPRKPEVEYISLNKLNARKQSNVQDDKIKNAYDSLQRLANNALKTGPFSITLNKSAPHIAPTGDPRDFLSYAPYWWPENEKDPNTKYVRKDGKRNPDIGSVQDQTQLESVTENLTFLILGYFFFNNENYAIHAVSLLDTFFINEKTRMNPNLNYAQFIRGPQNATKLGRGEGVISARSLARIVDLLPILDAFSGYYELKQKIQAWFAAYLQWLQTSPVALEAAKAKNNIHTWYVVQLASVQKFLNPVSPDASNSVLKYVKDCLPKQIDGKTGDQPLESKRTKPFHYLAFNMQAILYLTELAKDVGLDIYQNNNNLIHMGMHNITTVAKKDTGEDITVGVRCAEILCCSTNDNDNCCVPYIDSAYKCKFAEKLSGPKNAISVLWT